MISVSVKCDIDAQGVVSKLDNPEFWTFAASAWHALYRPFVAVDTGRMAGEVVYAPKTVAHTAPYAVYQYYSPDGAWDMKAIPSQAGALAQSLQGYIDGGGLGFGR